MRLTPGGGGAGDARLAPAVFVKATLQTGAGMRARYRARNARPYGVNAALGAPSRGPKWRAEVVAPYEIAQQFTFSRPTGWQSFRFP